MYTKERHILFIGIPGYLWAEIPKQPLKLKMVRYNVDELK